jgi:hypothetical protein
MLSPQETGTTPGQLGGRAGGRETGIPSGCLALAGGSEAELEVVEGEANET